MCMSKWDILEIQKEMEMPTINNTDKIPLSQFHEENLTCCVCGFTNTGVELLLNDGECYNCNSKLK